MGRPFDTPQLCCGVVDLDGDGIETVSVKNGVNFDFDNNGFVEKIGWLVLTTDYWSGT